jgi:hypothetical protein
VGTFNNATGKEVLFDCLDCTGGYFCSGTGNTDPTGLCEAGCYCTGAAEVSTPANDSSYGGNCEQGYFCPEGSPNPVECTPGHYCAIAYLNDTSGECDAGYYCSGSAVVPNPTDATTGKGSTFFLVHQMN